MEPINPYEAPKTPFEEQGQGPRARHASKVASGQRLIIYAILANVAIIALDVAFGALARPLSFVPLIMSLVGVLRVASGMGMSTALKIGLVVFMFVPLVNLITLLVLNSRATSMLRREGYEVGLLGATAPAAKS